MKKTLNLNQYMVQELNRKESLEIIGGGWWQDLKAGFVRGWNSFWSDFGEFFAAYSEVFE